MEPQTGDLLRWAPVASAAISAFAACVAAANVHIQNRNAARNRSLDLLLKKEAEFEGPRMRKARARAAKALLAGEAASPAVDELLDFMESAAALVASQDLEEIQAWSTFHHWFSRYGQACESVIKEEQGKDSEVWRDLANLIVRFDAIQMRRTRLSKRCSPEEMNRFLRQEELLEP